MKKTTSMWNHSIHKIFFLIVIFTIVNKYVFGMKKKMIPPDIIVPSSTDIFDKTVCILNNKNANSTLNSEILLKSHINEFDTHLFEDRGVAIKKENVEKIIIRDSIVTQDKINWYEFKSLKEICFINSKIDHSIISFKRIKKIAQSCPYIRKISFSGCKHPFEEEIDYEKIEKEFESNNYSSQKSGFKICLIKNSEKNYLEAGIIQMIHNYNPTTFLQKLCNKFGITVKEAQEILCGSLHDLYKYVEESFGLDEGKKHHD